MKRFSFVALLLFAFTCSISAQLTFSFNDMVNTRRVSDPQLSPDGRMIAYSMGIVDKAANKALTQIYTMSIDGTNQRAITSGTSSSSSPRWSPDGRHIAFATGGQIWTMEPDGDDKEQITKISSSASQPVWSPDGKRIAFVSTRDNPPGLVGIWLVRPDGTDLRQVVPGGG
ncbi:MAG: PD40 domain-containing protein, partial [Blastocatellia bacterium]|nr:PD40 domain-containing protein [Blastocatellia bacterium]